MNRSNEAQLEHDITRAEQARAVLDIASPDDIESVTIEADPAGHSDQFSGAPAKRRPTQVVEAQFAQPFLVATALVHGKVGIAEVGGLGDAAGGAQVVLERKLEVSRGTVCR